MLSTYIISDAECIKEDDDYIVVDAPDFDEPEVIFKDRIIEEESEVNHLGDSGDLVVTRGFAKSQGWI
jgi:hypothetical protein